MTIQSRTEFFFKWFYKCKVLIYNFQEYKKTKDCIDTMTWNINFSVKSNLIRTDILDFFYKIELNSLFV